MPVVKDKKTGKYMAILSDTSTDRDDEQVGEECIRAWAADPHGLPALTDHKASIDNIVGKWINKQLITDEHGNVALMAECDFYSEKASPAAARVKALLDEGAELGVSIGAIVYRMIKTGLKTDTTELWGQKYDSREIFKWIQAELVESSWVAIPSNRNAFGFAAKRFNIKFAGGQPDKQEVPTMAEPEQKGAMPPQDMSKELEVLNQKIAQSEAAAAELKAKNDELAKELEKVSKELQLAQAVPKHPDASTEEEAAPVARRGFLENIAMLRGIPPGTEE